VHGEVAEISTALLPKIQGRSERRSLATVTAKRADSGLQK